MKTWGFIIFALQKTLIKLLEEMEISWAVIKADEASWLANREPTSSDSSTGASVAQGQASPGMHYGLKFSCRAWRTSRMYLWESFLRTRWPFVIVKSLGSISKQEADWCAHSGQIQGEKTPDREAVGGPTTGAWACIRWLLSTSECDREPRSKHVSTCTKYAFPVSTGSCSDISLYVTSLRKEHRIEKPH